MISWLRSGVMRSGIDRELKALERDLAAEELSEPFVGYIMRLASIQSSTLVAIAARQIDDLDMAKASLTEAAIALQTLTAELGELSERRADTSGQLRERLTQISRKLGGG